MQGQDIFIDHVPSVAAARDYGEDGSTGHRITRVAADGLRQMLASALSPRRSAPKPLAIRR
jgi:hypothetical protein